MGHGETQAALRKDGITTYQFAAPEQTRRIVPVAVVDRPGEIGEVDIVVLAVKNYSLEAVARQVHEELDDRPIIVSMANGIDNQRILPKFFSKVIYCVVGYNARRDGPTVIGYQHKGSLLIGTPDNTLGAELRRVPANPRPRLPDGNHRPPAGRGAHQDRNQSDQCAGYAGRARLAAVIEYRGLSAAALTDPVGGRTHRSRRRLSRAPHPGHSFFCLAARDDAAPRVAASRPLFKRRLRAMAMSSMTQDVALRGATDTELVSITGYIVQLAAEHSVPAPYNRAIYRLGREKFHPGFEPLSCEAVLAAVERERMRSAA